MLFIVRHIHTNAENSIHPWQTQQAGVLNEQNSPPGKDVEKQSVQNPVPIVRGIGFLDPWLLSGGPDQWATGIPRMGVRVEGEFH